MRTLVSLAVAILITALPKLSAAPTGLNLEAKEVVSSATGHALKRIVVTVSDPTHAAPSVRVNVYFIGRAPNNGPRFIYADAEISMNLHGLASATAKVDAAELRHDRIKRSPPKGMAFTEIGDAEGWIVIGASDGKVFQVRASNAALLTVGEGKSSDSLKAMIADYRQRQQSATSR